jgi:2-oxoglutarate dehydrogenase E2 component (dihydrolipoamide succinyltransferase)
MIDIKVPALPESVADATVAKWYKSSGDSVNVGEKLLDLETDKVMLEIEAEESGIIENILQQEGAVVKAGDLLASLKAGAVAVVAEKIVEKQEEKVGVDALHTPSVRKILHDNDLTGEGIVGSGKNNKLTKQDVQNFIANSSTVRGPRRVPMSRLRAKVAERLNDSQKNAVILTTFNEVDLTEVIKLRSQYKDEFQKKHDIKLGFMSFFVKAVVMALKDFPIVNASVDGQDILYHDYFDIGVAIAAPRGLVVPVIRDADSLSMAQIEKAIKNYALQAKENKLSIDDMTGGTFTITNGGTFGSMLSTPIINPPQSGILGMHNIVKRPVVINDQVVIRSMMYLALSYDHRIIDGSDSVRFLVMIKKLLEDPARLLLDI